MSAAKQQEETPTTPEQWAERWQTELSAAKKWFEKFHTRGDAIDKVFRDEREAEKSGETRWNLYSSGIQTKRALLYGKMPTVTVARRFSDSGDDEARVAGELIERLLNSDMEDDGDCCAEALGLSLDDRLNPGLGVARLRYECEMETVPGMPAMTHPETGVELAPEVPETQRKCSEEVETDYIHWKDVLWSPARFWREVRWVAFRAQMSRKELVKRFGEEVGEAVPLSTKTGRSEEEEQKNPWGRADVWEVWDKDTKSVYWYVEGYGKTLDIQPDPHGLDGFFPFPRPMVANTTTSKFLPVPDYSLSQDIHIEINLLATRIQLLERAIRVTGVYDSAAGDTLGMMLNDGAGTNKLYPVDNWAMFAEKGGIRGQVDWFPLEQVVAAIGTLTERVANLKDILYEIEGTSDIMRGQSGQQGVTATEQGIKARFGSIRIQALQDEFARFASDTQRIKAQLIAKHFEPQTILECSNAQYLSKEDQQFVQPAIALIKSDLSRYRIDVKPENVSLTDFSAQKNERTEVISAISQFMVSVGPVSQQLPGSMPFLLQILQWMVAGLRGATQIEGVLDQAIAQAQQAAAQAAANPRPQQPDPKLQVQMLKSQQDMQKIQADTQSKIQIEQAKVEGDATREQNQRIENVREAAEKHLIEQSGNYTSALGPRRQGP